MELESERKTKPGSVQTHIDEHDRSATLAVVDAVATLRGEDPLDMSVVLADVVDPDALERLVGSRGSRLSDGSVTFAFAGCHVRVHADGQVRAYRVATDGGQ
jgi:hypothetical protein